MTREQARERAVSLMADGLHCSEAVVIAAGEYLWGSCPEVLVRAATPLGGGVSGSREEICGALSGALLIIGAQHGRTKSSEADRPAYDLARALREQFIDYATATDCSFVKEVAGSGELGCKAVVDRTMELLLALMN